MHIFREKAAPRVGRISGEIQVMEVLSNWVERIARNLVWRWLVVPVCGGWELWQLLYLHVAKGWGRMVFELNLVILLVLWKWKAQRLTLSWSVSRYYPVFAEVVLGIYTLYLNILTGCCREFNFVCTHNFFFLSVFCVILCVILCDVVYTYCVVMQRTQPYRVGFNKPRETCSWRDNIAPTCSIHLHNQLCFQKSPYLWLFSWPTVHMCM